MNRFVWYDKSNTPSYDDENILIKVKVCTIYDGDEKTAFCNGCITVTSFRLFWRDPKDPQNGVDMDMKFVSSTEIVGLWRNKIIVHLKQPEKTRVGVLVAHSSANYITIKCEDKSASSDLSKSINVAVQQRSWERCKGPKVVGKGLGGISGIQRRMENQNKETEGKINSAFVDCNELMIKAKEMVTLARVVSQRMKDKKGDITDDETVRFRSYLLSLGVDDPVTRSSCDSDNIYLTKLSREIDQLLYDTIKECGGMMQLSNAYCRVNRARGLQLISPEDLVGACSIMESLRLRLCMRILKSGVKVLTLADLDEASIVEATSHIVAQRGSITAEELALLINLSVVLTKERLLLCENAGALCRDVSPEGLRFFPNLFLHPDGLRD